MTHLESVLEEVSLELILADSSEPESFSSLLPLVKTIFETAKSSTLSELAEDAKRAGKLIKGIVDQTAEDPADQVEALHRIISEMQSFLHMIARMPAPPPPETGDVTPSIPLPSTVTSPPPDEPESVPPPNEKVEPSDPPESQSLLHPGTLPSYLNMDDFSEFLSLQGDALARIETLLLDIEKNSQDQNAQGELKRLFHTTKGEAGFLGLIDVERICHKAEDLIESERFIDHVDTLFSVKDWLESTFAVYSGQTPPTPPDPVDQMVRRLKERPSTMPPDVSPPSVETSRQTDADPTSVPKEIPSLPLATDLQSDTPSVPPPDAVSSPISKIAASIHVDAQKLDRLVEMIGEISIAESMVTQSPELSQNASPELLRAMNILHKTTRELQSLGLSLRMIPLKSTFQRMERVVRDLSKKTGKQIHFKMSGEGTELDKNIVDRLSDPLIHLIRNCVDHGVESDSQSRVKMGKPEAATISLRAFQKGGFLYIEVTDDGKGVDRNRLLEKAKAAGLLPEAFELSPQTTETLLDLIFHPGLSTAKVVTDISGRGVGMDVVKKSIDACKGKVSIASLTGKGTTCTIKLPLTLSIIDGLVVRVADEQYVIPTLSVVTSLKVTKRSLSNVFENAEMLDALGELMPLFRLSTLFKLKGKTAEAPWEGIVVVVEDGGRKTALLADELIGKQNTVIKSLGPGMEDVQGVSGATIMSDGRVSLILDIGGIVALSHKKSGDITPISERNKGE